MRTVLLACLIAMSYGASVAPECPKVSVSTRCGKPHGICSYGYCSKWNWCGNGGLWEQTHQIEYDSRPGCGEHPPKKPVVTPVAPPKKPVVTPVAPPKKPVVTPVAPPKKPIVTPVAPPKKPVVVPTKETKDANTEIVAPTRRRVLKRLH
jgi:hypothetical protein